MPWTKTRRAEPRWDKAFILCPPIFWTLKCRARRTESFFTKISLGYKRQPPLYATVAVDDRWAVITYLRALAKGKS